MTTSEERLSRLEGVYEHLATKADLAEVKADVAEVKAEMAHVATKADLALQETRLIKWMIGTVVTGMAAAAAVAVAVDRLLGG